MTTSEQINEVATACAKAQLELKPAAKDAKNPHFNSKYADLAAIVEAARVFAKHGVAVFQDVTTSEAGASVETRLVHASGQWIQFGPLTIPMSKRDAHGAGSATTYAKRYALQGALNISADEDDDGNAAVQPSSKPHAVAKTEPVTVVDGYDEWLVTFWESANHGLVALRQTYKLAPVAFRDYLMKHDKVKYEQITKRAEQVDLPPANVKRA